jgi:hypothetical protein
MQTTVHRQMNGLHHIIAVIAHYAIDLTLAFTALGFGYLGHVFINVHMLHLIPITEISSYLSSAAAISVLIRLFLHIYTKYNQAVISAFKAVTATKVTRWLFIACIILLTTLVAQCYYTAHHIYPVNITQ